MAKIDLNLIAKQAIKSSSRRSIHQEEEEEKARVFSIWQRLKQINARNPLERLPPIHVNESQISRIYLLTYFRSGSSFLGKQKVLILKLKLKGNFEIFSFFEQR